MIDNVVISAASRAAELIGTPFYLYDATAAGRVLGGIQQGLREWGPGQIAYSVKTNPLAALLSEVRSAGAWAEVVSDAEYHHARACGFAADEIVFNGPLKAGGVTAGAVAGALINIDTIEEVDVVARAADELGVDARIGLRVCPPFTAPSWSRFGLSVESGEWDEAIKRVTRAPRLHLQCIHSHLGTQVPSRAVYRSALRFVRDLWAEYQLGEEVWLDIGGGYGFAHDTGQPTDSWAAFFADLAAAWPAPRPFLLLEPGRVVAAPTLALVSRVLALKRRPREPVILVTDGGTNHNVMGAFYEHDWRFADVHGEPRAYRICGPLCMEDDVMSGERFGPLPERGSLALMHNAGAYSLSLARNFIQPVPPVVRVLNQDVQVLVPRADYSLAFGACVAE